MRCEAKMRVGRPDKGPETRCTRNAKFRVPQFDVNVCGYHKRSYTNYTPILRVMPDPVKSNA